MYVLHLVAAGTSDFRSPEAGLSITVPGGSSSGPMPTAAWWNKPTWGSWRWEEQPREEGRQVRFFRKPCDQHKTMHVLSYPPLKIVERIVASPASSALRSGVSFTLLAPWVTPLPTRSLLGPRGGSPVHRPFPLDETNMRDERHQATSCAVTRPRRSSSSFIRRRWCRVDGGRGFDDKPRGEVFLRYKLGL